MAGSPAASKAPRAPSARRGCRQRAASGLAREFGAGTRAPWARSLAVAESGPVRRERPPPKCRSRPPGNARRPVAISNRTAPNAQMSARLSTHLAARLLGTHVRVGSLSRRIGNDPSRSVEESVTSGQIVPAALIVTYPRRVPIRGQCRRGYGSRRCSTSKKFSRKVAWTEPFSSVTTSLGSTAKRLPSGARSNG